MAAWLAWHAMASLGWVGGARSACLPTANSISYFCPHCHILYNIITYSPLPFPFLLHTPHAFVYACPIAWLHTYSSSFTLPQPLPLAFLSSAPCFGILPSAGSHASSHAFFFCPLLCHICLPPGIQHPIAITALLFCLYLAPCVSFSPLNFYFPPFYLLSVVPLGMTLYFHYRRRACAAARAFWQQITTIYRRSGDRGTTRRTARVGMALGVCGALA